MFSFVAIGRSKWLYDSICTLVSNGYRINGIITSSTPQEYRKREEDFELLAKKLKVPFFKVNSLEERNIEKICRCCDVAISVNWVSVIQKKHIDWFNIGILNAHFGDLPRYRGNACPNWAILSGEKEIFLSIHLMEGGKLDCGRVIVQKKIGIDTNVYIEDIYAWAEEAIPQAFLEAVKRIEVDPDYYIKYADIKDDASFRCFPRLPVDGFIDWTKSAVYVDRLIKASGPPLEGAYTYHEVEGKIRKLYIYKSRVVEIESKDLAMPGQILKNDVLSGESWVRCGDDVLSLSECKYSDENEPFAPGKRWKSIRMRLGVRPEDWLWKIWKVMENA